MPRSDIANAKTSVYNLVSFGVIVVTVTLWVTGSFVEKSSAKEFSDAVERRFMRIDQQYDRLEGKIDKIEDDVAIVRGILEARSRKKSSD